MNLVSLWTKPQGSVSDRWWVRRGPLDIILLDTPEGTLLITINSSADDWEMFLPVAEEILAGISFPDL